MQWHASSSYLVSGTTITQSDAILMHKYSHGVLFFVMGVVVIQFVVGKINGVTGKFRTGAGEITKERENRETCHGENGWKTLFVSRVVLVCWCFMMMCCRRWEFLCAKVGFTWKPFSLSLFLRLTKRSSD